MSSYRLPEESHPSDRRFLIEVRRLAEVLEFGLDASRFRGPGIDFLQSRPYEFGDPVESIDWRVTARTHRLHVKEHESLRGTPLYVVVDRSASMCTSSVSRSKYSWAVRLAGAFAFAALGRLSPVGLYALGKRPVFSAPSLGSAKVRGWLRDLRAFPLDDDRSLRDSLRQLEVTIQPPGLLIVLSDLHDPEARRLLKGLAHRYETIIIQLHDPAERGEVSGFFRGREAETGRGFLGRQGDRWIDPAQVADELRGAPLDRAFVDISKPVASKIARFLKSRVQRARRS